VLEGKKILMLEQVMRVKNLMGSCMNALCDSVMNVYWNRLVTATGLAVNHTELNLV
jgi:hypothetical protein